MEKQQNIANCESMATTVTMKDYQEYQEPPPAYKGVPNNPMVQVAKIVAIAAVLVAGMLSFSIVFSAWLHSTAVCQQQSTPQILDGVRAELLKASENDPDSEESRLSESDSSGEEGDSPGLSLIRLPLELNLHEHMFEKNRRSHMNCIVEKKKAEEIVDEQSKNLPPLLGLGINMTTDPRYLHFTGEKMAISCDSGNEHHMPLPPHHLPPPPPFMEGPPPPPFGYHHPMNIPIPFNMLNPSQMSGGGPPIHIIGPVPFNPLYQQQQQELPSHLIPLFFPQRNQNQHHPLHHHHHHLQQQQPQFTGNGLDEGLILFPQPQLQQQPPRIQIQLNSQSGEMRERMPVMPRQIQQNFQHVIRPRSVDAVEGSQHHNRMKRCACDCSCKNHNQQIN